MLKLKARNVEKPWGRTALPAPFTSTGARIGEIWFEPPAAAQELLIKYIFTSEKLSVQVHPGDQQAQARGAAQGKDECWYVLDAEPDAVLGMGLREPLSKDALREAALSGEIETLLDWKPVKAGDFFYIPAGTVHAIGAGIALVEVQQNIDITYRLYDYGRPRELHLDDAVDVACRAPYPDALWRHVEDGSAGTLVAGDYFTVALCDDAVEPLDGNGPHFILPLSGSLQGGVEEASIGECLACDSPEELTVAPGTRMIVARAAG